MAGFQKACALEEVGKGALKRARIGRASICLANVGGKLFAIEDSCTHADCSLAEGSLEGKTVTCPCHGSQFDATSGAVLRGPAKRPALTYETRIDGDQVWVKV